MIDVGTMFSSSWNKFSKNIGMGIVIFLVGYIVASILSAFTLGIAGIPVYAGVFKAFRKMQRGETPELNDVFSEFSNFSQWFMLWVVALVIGVVLSILYFILAITVVGVVLLPFIGIALGLFLFFMMPLMLDRRMPAMEAVKASIDKVKNNFGPLFLPIFLVLLVSGVFVILTGPWMMIAWWDVYDAAFSA